MGTFLAFPWTSHWYEWYMSEGPGVEFKVACEHCAELAQKVSFIQLPKVKELLYRITDHELNRRSIIYFQC